MTGERSNRAIVRNPILTLPAVRLLQGLPAPERAALRSLLLDLHHDATSRAQACWKKNKAPMAAYWKAVAVYSRHTARSLNTESKEVRAACQPT